MYRANDNGKMLSSDFVAEAIKQMKIWENADAIYTIQSVYLESISLSNNDCCSSAMVESSVTLNITINVNRLFL